VVLLVVGDEVVEAAMVVVVVVSTATGMVVGVGSDPAFGQRAQIPTAKPTTIRPASSRRITAWSNLRRHVPRVKGSPPGPRKFSSPSGYG
jgi:hypothetical protein